MRKYLWMVLAIGLTALSIRAEEPPVESPKGWRWVVNPLVGVDRNELHRTTPSGTTTQTDTGPELGLFAMAIHPNFVLNNFFFFADVNDSDVWGNLTYLNYYADAKAAVTWNAGVGYLYHKIETPGPEITVNDPMVKAGPVFRIADWHLSLNPYLGYAWEVVDTAMSSPHASFHTETNNESMLYGLTLGWRWRMFEAGLNYYFQDSLELEENFNVLRARVIGMVTRDWGLSARLDYSEHSTSKDRSFLIGPVFLF
jgi:hypothetical protein